MKAVSFNLDDVAFSDVKKLADLNGVSQSDFLRQAVREYVSQQKSLILFSEITNALANVAKITDLKDPEQLKHLEDLKTIIGFLGDKYNEN